MARSLADIQAEITRLKKEADKVRSAEIKEVVARIRKAVSHYGLTAEEIFGKPRRSAAASKAGLAKKRGSTAKKGKAPKSKAAAVIRFKDELGNSWVGRGKRPQWLRDALAAGRKIEEFAVK